MRKFVMILGSLALAGSALADNASCQSAATAQKLSGQARTAFLKQCEADAKARLTLTRQDQRMSRAPTGEFGHCSHGEKDL